MFSPAVDLERAAEGRLKKILRFSQIYSELLRILPHRSQGTHRWAELMGTHGRSNLTQFSAAAEAGAGWTLGLNTAAGRGTWAGV